MFISHLFKVTATREDLSDSLCPCLCAIPEFGEHCLSLAIEKLESTLLIAKIDSLKLLVSCIFNNFLEYE